MSSASFFTWSMAEELALGHMRAIGYRDARRTPPGADGGVDVTSKDAVAQVKDYVVPVSRPELQKLTGVAHDGRQAIFYARSGYTSQALAWAEQVGMALFSYTVTNDVLAVSTRAHALAADRGEQVSLTPEELVALRMRQIADVVVPFNQLVQHQVYKVYNTQAKIDADRKGFDALDQATKAYERLDKVVWRIRADVRETGWDAPRFSEALETAFFEAHQAGLQMGFDAQRAMHPLGAYEFCIENGKRKIKGPTDTK